MLVRVGALLLHLQSSKAQTPSLILLTANTNTALEGLLRRVAGLKGILAEVGLVKEKEEVDDWLSLFLILSSSKKGKASEELPQVLYKTLYDVDDGNPFTDLLTPKSGGRIRVVAGTVNQLLKFALKAKEPTQKKGGKEKSPGSLLPATYLLADEGSQLPFVHLLPLATLLLPPLFPPSPTTSKTAASTSSTSKDPYTQQSFGGSLLVAGDHRQLTAITAFNWGGAGGSRACSAQWRAHLSAYNFLHAATGGRLWNVDDYRAVPGQTSL